MSSTPQNKNPKTKNDKFGRLVISVKASQPVFIGDDIVVMWNPDHKDQVRLLIIAPKTLSIKRG